jgi:group II intron reverse transcriptase/maturase
MIEEITSRRALRQAFGRVRDNGGCRGADGVTLAAFEANLETELDRLEGSLLRRCYRPFPLLRFPVPKRSGGERFLAVPTVRDRVIQTAVYDATRPVFEAELEDVSHAFRVGRSVRSAIHQIDQLRSEGYGWIVDADIDGFFDAIPRRRLLERVRRLRLHAYVASLFELWAHCEVYDGARVFVPERGIAQGSVVSPMLANLFLDELDENPRTICSPSSSWSSTGRRRRRPPSSRVSSFLAQSFCATRSFCLSR